MLEMVSPRLTDLGLLKKSPNKSRKSGPRNGHAVTLVELGIAEMVERPKEGTSSHPSDSSPGQPPSDLVARGNLILLVGKVKVLRFWVGRVIGKKCCHVLAMLEKVPVGVGWLAALRSALLLSPALSVAVDLCGPGGGCEGPLPMTKSHEVPHPRMLFPYQTLVPHLGVVPGSLGTECPIVESISDISMLKASPKIRRLLCNTQRIISCPGDLAVLINGRCEGKKISFYTAS